MIGVDLGSAKLGIVLTGNVLPLLVVGAASPDLDDPGAMAERLRGFADFCRQRDVVVEFGQLYIPAGAPPQKARAMAANHATMDRLLFFIWQALPGPFYRVTTIARRTWSSRVLPGHRGGITTAEASAALALHLSASGAWPLLSDQHRRDAVGAVVGYLLGSARRHPTTTRSPRGKRIRCTSVTLARRAHDARMDAILPAQQAAVAKR